MSAPARAMIVPALLAILSLGLLACTDADTGVDATRSDASAPAILGPAGTTPLDAPPDASSDVSPDASPDVSMSAADTGVTTTAPQTVDDLALADLTTGLAALTSYHQELAITVTTAGSLDSVEMTVADVWPGRALVVTDSTTTADGATSSRVGGFVAGTVFSSWDGGDCAVAWQPITPVPPAENEPALRLPPLLTMTTGASTQVEGRQATTASGATVEGPDAGLVTLTIDDTGLVLTYALALSVGDVAVTYTYSVSSVDALPEPVLPAGCAAPLTEIPAIDGATSVRRMPGVLDYVVALDPTAVADFYRSTMPTIGWTADGEAVSDPAHQRLWFVDAGGSEAVLLVTVDATGTWVNITVRPAAAAVAPGG